MGLRHVYVQDILNTTMVVVLQVLFHYFIIYEMGPPRLGKQVKESKSRAAPFALKPEDLVFIFFPFMEPFFFYKVSFIISKIFFSR